VKVIFVNKLFFLAQLAVVKDSGVQDACGMLVGLMKKAEVDSAEAKAMADFQETIREVISETVIVSVMPRKPEPVIELIPDTVSPVQTVPIAPAVVMPNLGAEDFGSKADGILKNIGD
jgi:hypothetical protein